MCVSVGQCVSVCVSEGQCVSVCVSVCLCVSVWVYVGPFIIRYACVYQSAGVAV